MTWTKPEAKRGSLPEYSRLKRAVKKRDQNTCQMPGCKNTKKIQVHHIIRWSDAPSLRYNPDNCLCLCETCHEKITGFESYYTAIFQRIAVANKKKPPPPKKAPALSAKHKKNRDIFNEQRDVIMDMEAQGKSLSQISKVLGMSLYYLKRFIQDENL